MLTQFGSYGGGFLQLRYADLLTGLFQSIGLGRLLGALLVFCLLAIRIADPSIVSEMRFTAFDFYQRIKPREPQGLPVAIVDIDDASLEELGQWPWPRTRMGDLVTGISRNGAVALGFDIVFSEPDRLSPEKIAEDNPSFTPEVLEELRRMARNDDVFAKAIASSRVILGQSSVRTNDANRDTKIKMRAVAHAVIGGDPHQFLNSFPDILQNLPVLEDAATGRGMFSVRPDEDGIYRRVPLVMRVQDQIRLGLAPELLRVATGADAFAVRVNEAGIEGVVLARQFIETAADGSVWPYYSPSSRARYVSAADILADRLPAQRLAGHLVLIGTSAIGLEDFRPTPLGKPMPGVEIHAQLLENILSKTLLKRPNYAVAVELVAALILSFFVVLIAPRSGAVLMIALTISLAVGWAGSSYYLFSTNQILIDPVWPVFCIISSVMLMSSLNYLREERLRQHIRSAFGQYVSPDLVASLAENRDRLALGGDRRELTILFSDVRGFTTLSEKYREDPGGLTKLMNQFLTVLSKPILDQRGTIDKFMGDAVMAFWNAPLETADHEHAACRAALTMQKDIKEFNRFRVQNAQDEDVLPIDVGIGINSGTCIVGNMGSDTRFDYTALGDAVNLASRLEGQSKAYGIKIVLGESTARAVEREFAVIELDLIRVKGKTRPERIFGLLGGVEMREDSAFAALSETNSAMRTAYNQKDWTGAQSALDRLMGDAKALHIDIADYAALYVRRIQAFSENAPGDEWDGVYVAETK
ncbi:CHASE2 domain-containing protein [Roseovarius marisflavi]|uniref:CHASE2 domain-containing protein n=1 Tax=Roseovarius marisflavi TaxID=1054996 RepID=UPI001C662189|nr:adenylate/guanylate cyclase domain-containing protein [Roseovarius marisflavi]